MWRPSINLLLLAGLTLLPLGASAKTLSGTTRWSGTVTLTEAISVPRGATLIITAGTTVVPQSAGTPINVGGKLLVEGTAAAPVVFKGKGDWAGIEFFEAEGGSRIRHARFNGAAAALSTVATPFIVADSHFEKCEVAIKLVREGTPTIENNIFTNNAVGISSEMKSVPVIRGNRFSKHSKSAIVASHGSRGDITDNRFIDNQQGIALIQRYEGKISANQFSGNEAAIFCNQTQSTPRIEKNRFEKNKLAIINFSFSYPAIVGNQFLNNGTALQNDQYGSPVVENNLFRGNGTALHNNKKSNPKVRLNQIENNELAFFVDYSSYPEVKQNNFTGNRMAVKLGIYQSADWERRSGSRGIMQREAEARQSQNPLLAKAPTEFSDTVDVSDNWWGNESAQLVAAGEKGNVAMFHDRHDQPEVSYEKDGFGPGKFKLDRIRFAPWLKGAVAGAGPKEKP